MDTWTPQTLYGCAFATAACVAIAAYIRSGKPVTFWRLLAEGVFHGLVGAGLGAVVHEWKFKTKPGTVLAVAIGWGAGVFSLADVKAVLGRVLNLPPSRDRDERQDS
jgi:hypothetical protein